MQKSEWIVCGVIASALLTGCTKDEDTLSYQSYKDAEAAPATAHSHGTEGVNGGHVIEVGDAHAIHAELVFDKATRNITLYFYGAKIGEPKTVSGLEFELNHGGNEVAVESRATPLDGETAEAASKFVVSGEALPKEITSEEQLDGHFHVTVDGSEYVGSFHAHSHDAHAHEHDDAKHADEGHAQDKDGAEHGKEGHEHDKDGADHGKEGPGHDKDGKDHEPAAPAAKP